MEKLEAHLSDPLIQKLFRIFLLFLEETCESSDVEVTSGKQSIHVEEVQLLSTLISKELFLPDPAVHPKLDCPKHILSHSSGATCWTSVESLPCTYCEISPVFATKVELLSFNEMVLVIGQLFPSRSVLEPAISSVYDQLVNQVIKKGYLVKCSHRGFSGRWRLGWCVVYPGRMQFRKTVEKLGNTEEIILSKNCTVLEGKEEKGRWLWSLKLSERKYQFACPENLERQQWIAAVRLAIARSEACQNYHKYLFLARKGRREAKITTSVAEEKDKNDLIRVVEWEQRRKRDLESEVRHLELQLSDERRATKDEELVRNFATRMLEEERTRREVLEKLNQTQRTMLDKEKSLRRKSQADGAQKTMELAALREQVDRMHADLKQREIAAVTKMRSTSPDRRHLLQQLKRDHKALVNHQLALDGHHNNNNNNNNGHYSGEIFSEVDQVLNRLVENSRKRNSLSPSFNGSLDSQRILLMSSNRSSSVSPDSAQS